MAFNEIEISEYGGRPLEFFKFTAGGVVYRYTSGVASITLATGDSEKDGAYTAVPIALGELEHARDVGQLRVEIRVARDNPVAQLFKSAPPDSAVAVKIFKQHQGDSEVINWFSGSVLTCEKRESEAVLSCQPVVAQIARLGLRQRWQPQCNLETYSARCGVDIDDFTDSVTVAAIDGNVLTLTGLPSHPDGWYNGGYVRTSDGTRRFIESHVGDEVTLILDIEGLEVGDTLDIIAGDDHLHTTCRDKFDNIINFFGFFTTPGRNPWTQGGLKPGGSA